MAIYIFAASFLILMGFYLLVFARFTFGKWGLNETGLKEQPPVSVVICAHNEAANLQRFLPKVLEQDYTDFEVVVVNDRSIDNSQEILNELAKKYGRLKLVCIPTEEERKFAGKRDALLRGVEHAKYDILLLTDADCYPATGRWIAEMIRPFQEGKEIVLGFSPYEKRDGLLNLFIRYETFYTALQYLSFAYIGRPYMGVGRSLAYHRSITKRASSLRNESVLSGDDDLLVNEMASSDNTAVVLSPDSFIFSVPADSWKSWLHQKRRHAQAGFHYRLLHRVLLALLNGSMILMHISLIYLLISGFVWSYAVYLFIGKLLFQCLLYGRIMKRLKQRELLIFLPVADFMLSVFLVTLACLSLFKISAWKRT